MKNIYFVGKAGAGKSYASKYLCEKYNYILAKFAYPVYHLAEDYCGMIQKDRKLLQIIGTDIGREKFGIDIWVQRFIQDLAIIKKTYQRLYNQEVRFVSDDVRFINEHNVLKSNDWVGIYLDVPDNIRIERLKRRDGNPQINTLNHSSEKAIDSFKKELIIIDASGSLENTYNELEKVIYRIKKGEL